MRTLTNAKLLAVVAGFALPCVAAPLAAQATTPTPQAAAPAPKHHSKLKGAVVGGAAGAAVGHPKIGAAAGAMHQHRKNKKAARAQ